MRKIKISRLYWTLIFSFCAYGGGARGISLCSRISMELGVAEFETLCDLDFCTCHDPYGRIRCVCPGQDPDEELIIKSRGPCSVPHATTSLSLDNCTRVTVIQNAFDELKDLQNLQFINIKQVTIESHSFHSTGSPRSVNFTNSTIPDLPSFSFTGNIGSLVFENCYIGMIRAFAFSSINDADNIVFRGTNVANVEAQSFKKFTMNKFLIIDSQFNVIPSRFVVDVVVDILFKIESTFIDSIRTLGFKISNPKKVILIDSMINKLYGESFKIVSRGDVIMDSNIINSIDNEAFRGLSVDKQTLQQSGKPKFKFQNQTLTNLESKSLYVNRTNFDVQITTLMIDEPCTCDGLILWKDMITLGKKPLDSVENELEPIWCHMDDRKEGNFDYVPGRNFYKEYCTQLTSSIYFFVIIITTTAVSIAVVIAILLCIFRNHWCRKWKPVPTSSTEADRNSQRKLKGDKKNGKKIGGGGGGGRREAETTKAIIVPDGRTYKETEFHIIVEKAEPLDEECIPYTVVRDRSRTQMN